MPLLQRFQAAWKPPSQGPVTLLLSGGGDSTALFFLLLQTGTAFSCLHFQHDSPGEFASESLRFCRNLCRAHRVNLLERTARASVLEARGDLSWEAAASLLRYRAIAQGPGIFLTAHTADDQAETLVMRLLDGSGLAGLAGIRADRSGRIQRPLLPFRRAQLRDFLQELGQPWMEDPSNLGGNDRARLRHAVMPVLERFQPALVATLCRTAEGLAADEQALTELACRWLERHCVEGDHWPLQTLTEQPSAIRHRILRQLWRDVSDGSHRPLGGLFRECERLVMSAQDDRQVPFPGGCKLRRLGDWLWVEPAGEPTPWRRSVGADAVHGTGWSLHRGVLDTELDPSWIRLPLPAGVFGPGKQYEVRTRLPGDTYRKRNLKKLLAASGHPPWVRDRWPLLVREGQVVAVPGLSKGPDLGEGWLLFRPDSLRWRGRKMKL